MAALCANCFSASERSCWILEAASGMGASGVRAAHAARVNTNIATMTYEDKRLALVVHTRRAADPERDLVPVSLGWEAPLVLVVGDICDREPWPFADGRFDFAANGGALSVGACVTHHQLERHPFAPLPLERALGFGTDRHGEVVRSGFAYRP